MVFPTQYSSRSLRSRLHTEPGSPVKIVYQANYDARGNLRIEESGQEDLYGYIQSHRDSVDIHVILKRFAAGEVDVLSQVQGFYADCADMPSTYAEVLNAVLAGERTFNSLPADVKQQFGNSFSHWLASFDSPDFSARMGWTPADSDMSPSQVQDFASGSAAPAAPAAPVASHSSD